MVNFKSQAFALDEATGLHRYGFVETRFLIFLCNHLHQSQSSMTESEFDLYVDSRLAFNNRELSEQMEILGKDARRIFSHADQTFNHAIAQQAEGRWIDYSRYTSGQIIVQPSKQLIKLLKEQNPYLYHFDVGQIRDINSVGALRFLNYLCAQKVPPKTKIEITLGLDELRTIFGVEESYTCLSNIRSKVIGKSIRLINANTNFDVKIQRKASVIDDLNYTFKVELKEMLAA